MSDLQLCAAEARELEEPAMPPTLPSPSVRRIAWRFERSPSFVANLLRAFASFGRRGTHPPPPHEATLEDLVPDLGRYAAFLSVCGSPARGDLHPLYPFALGYPLIMRILTSRAMPFSAAQLLNTRTVIVQARPIVANEQLSLRCRNEGWRAASKGREIDLDLEAVSGGQCVWRCCATYLVRGAAAPAEVPAPATRLGPLAAAETLATWRVPPRDRFRFAVISGDNNGIHYGSWYARLLGFERDFAQPLRVVTRCVDRLPPAAMSWPVRIEFHLKGPAYYGRTLTLSGGWRRDRFRFDLHCGSDERPCITGQMGPAGELGAAGTAKPAPRER